jgi:hypothetical protein
MKDCAVCYKPMVRRTYTPRHGWNTRHPECENMLEPIPMNPAALEFVRVFAALKQAYLGQSVWRKA